MTITWLGHACFLLEEENYRIVVDPYRGVAGYPDTAVRAHACFCSHGHDDHSHRAGVTLLPEREMPFTVEEIASFHDPEQGALRGRNTIRRFTANGVTVCHLGDLGHPLDAEQTAAIGAVDVLLIPVGGFYTIDAEGARTVAEQIAPRCIVPMHYRHPPYGLPAVGGVDTFLAQYPKEQIRRLEGPSFPVAANLPKIVVPAYRRP